MNYQTLLENHGPLLKEQSNSTNIWVFTVQGPKECSEAAIIIKKTNWLQQLKISHTMP